MFNELIGSLNKGTSSMYSTSFRSVFSGLVGIIGTLCAALPAVAHNHISVDTSNGQCVCVAGYYPSEAPPSDPSFSISDHRLMENGEAAVYLVTDTLPDGSLAGWFAGDELILTSDYFFSSGRLAGGDFAFEIQSVVTLAGQPAKLSWGLFDENTLEFTPTCSSEGVTRADRSFVVGAGEHVHAQGFAFSDQGMYDVTLVVWDRNGMYADAAPMKVRFLTGAACPADVNGSGNVNVSDIFAFLSRWFARSPSADYNGIGGINISDVFSFITQWFHPC
jgi:hypothetical protein